MNKRNFQALRTIDESECSLSLPILLQRRVVTTVTTPNQNKSACPAILVRPSQASYARNPSRTTTKTTTTAILNTHGSIFKSLKQDIISSSPARSCATIVDVSSSSSVQTPSVTSTNVSSLSVQTPSCATSTNVSSLSVQIPSCATVVDISSSPILIPSSTSSSSTTPTDITQPTFAKIELEAQRLIFDPLNLSEKKVTDESFNLVERIWSAYENSVLVLNPLWLGVSSSMAKTNDDWIKLANNMHSGRLNALNLPILFPYIANMAATIVIPVCGHMLKPWEPEVSDSAVNHWSVLVVYRYPNQPSNYLRIVHYDSCINIHDTPFLETFFTYLLLSPTRQLFGEYPEISKLSEPVCIEEFGIQTVSCANLQQQNDSWSCGFRVLMLIELLVRRASSGRFAEPSEDELEQCFSTSNGADAVKLFKGRVHAQLTALISEQRTRLVQSAPQLEATVNAEGIIALGMPSGYAADMVMAHCVPIFCRAGDTIFPDAAKLIDEYKAGPDFLHDMLYNKCDVPTQTDASITRRHKQRPFKAFMEDRAYETSILVSARKMQCVAKRTIFTDDAAMHSILASMILVGVEVLNTINVLIAKAWYARSKAIALGNVDGKGNVQLCLSTIITGVVALEKIGTLHLSSEENIVAALQERLDVLSPLYAADQTAYAKFAAQVRCALLCDEHLCVAPVTVRCFDTSTNRNGIVSSTQFGLARLWRSYVRPSTSILPLRKSWFARPVRSLYQFVEMTLYDYVLVDVFPSDFETCCSGVDGVCFWRFLANNCITPNTTIHMFMNALCNMYYREKAQ